MIQENEILDVLSWDDAQKRSEWLNERSFDVIPDLLKFMSENSETPASAPVPRLLLAFCAQCPAREVSMLLSEFALDVDFAQDPLFALHFLSLVSATSGRLDADVLSLPLARALRAVAVDCGEQESAVRDHSESGDLRALMAFASALPRLPIGAEGEAALRTMLWATSLRAGAVELPRAALFRSGPAGNPKQRFPGHPAAASALPECLATLSAAAPLLPSAELRATVRWRVWLSSDSLASLDSSMYPFPTPLGASAALALGLEAHEAAFAHPAALAEGAAGVHVLLSRFPGARLGGWARAAAWQLAVMRGVPNCYEEAHARLALHVLDDVHRRGGTCALTELVHEETLPRHVHAKVLGWLKDALHRALTPAEGMEGDLRELDALLGALHAAVGNLEEDSPLEAWMQAANAALFVGMRGRALGRPGIETWAKGALYAEFVRPLHKRVREKYELALREERMPEPEARKRFQEYREGSVLPAPVDSFEEFRRQNTMRLGEIQTAAFQLQQVEMFFENS